MKNLLMALLLCVSTTASAIQVLGSGKNFQEAKLNAFATAIEITVGTLILSEKESNNYQLVKNDILAYSSGYITDYKVISQTNNGNQVQVILDVKVSTNKISNRILVKNNNNSVIDGDKIKDQIDSYTNERLTGDRLLNTVLNDYPYRAYNLEQLNHYVKTENRQMQLVMPYKISWNYNYIKALATILEKTQDSKFKLLERPEGTVTIIGRSPDNLIGSTTKFYFNDLTHPRKISDSFYSREVRIMGEVINRNNQTVWYICHHPKFLSGGKNQFYGIGDVRNIMFLGNTEEIGEVRLDIGHELYKILNDVHKIKLRIVRTNDC